MSSAKWHPFCPGGDELTAWFAQLVTHDENLYISPHIKGHFSALGSFNSFLVRSLDKHLKKKHDWGNTFKTMWDWEILLFQTMCNHKTKDRYYKQY